MGLLPETVVVAGAALVMSAAYARAADMPEFLRGSTAPSYSRWDGFYFGVQAGKTFGSADFGNADHSLVQRLILANTELQGIVSNFTTLPKGSTGSASYGGFVGYNWQWDEVVLGGELNYNHVDRNQVLVARDSLGPILVPGANLPDGSTVLYAVAVTSAASVSIHDIVTARARAGWTFDRFMPYGFAGPRGQPGQRPNACDLGRQHQNDNVAGAAPSPRHGLIDFCRAIPKRKRRTARLSTALPLD